MNRNNFEKRLKEVFGKKAYYNNLVKILENVSYDETMAESMQCQVPNDCNQCTYRKCGYVYFGDEKDREVRSFKERIVLIFKGKICDKIYRDIMKVMKT
ncbi:MAG: hypothetical protein PHR25_02490 [Clostridia bacterium]|nr:hypothetical protein [Clostridia bacterium]MDD4375628.1 hypothetical protein [Clostridia bacterium]